MAIRCPFCSAPFEGAYPDREVGVHTVKCEACRRAFIIRVKKSWWGYSKDVRVR